MNDRPSLARKHTRASEAKRQDELNVGIRITVGDGDERDVFEVRVGDVTPALTKELRARTGMSFMRLMQTAADDPDVDVLTAIEWLARRIRGEAVEFDDVEFTYADLMGDGFEISEPSDVEVGGDPERPGRRS